MHRNNRGGFKDKTGRWVKFGVGDPGGSDLIGWTPTIVTQEMVGKKIAVFTAIEVKKSDWVPRGEDDRRRYCEQLNFIDQVRKAGGIAGVARCADHVRDLVKMFYLCFNG